MRKELEPATDPGLFNLQIDTVTEKANTGDYNPQTGAGTTGEKTVNTGSHSVGETAGTNTSLGDYDSSLSCVNQANNNATVGSTGGNVTVTKNADVLCTFTNKLKPLTTGAKTIGYWQNKNGQAIITGGASTSRKCNSGTWLRQYAPFQDLSATANCRGSRAYVTNIIKAANASGASMNAMLKAQMLATALDVYFSNPALGGNKIGAPVPIGGVSIDLTTICKMIDGSGGTATCSGTYQNVSSAFGGATSLTVSQMLSYAATQSNVGGSMWYGNVKATQELAKNAFDAINNQVAFGP